jgi:hypothetical protein
MITMLNVGDGKNTLYGHVRGTMFLMVKVTTRVVIKALSAAGSKIVPNTELI